MDCVLDTNICIYIIKQTPVSVYQRFQQLKVGQVGISAITYLELQFGVANSTRPEQNQDALDEFLAPLEILDFPAAAGPLYGRVHAHLRQAGTPLGALDLLIATHALFLGATLVTNDTHEFSRVPGLRLENWV